MASYIFVIFSVLLPAVFAEVVKINTCPGVNQTLCSVSEVRISPCPTFNYGKCIFKRGGSGTDASMSFDFTPNFTTSNLKTYVYWDNGFQDIPFPDMGDDNGCLYTTCPTESGHTQQFNYNLHIGSKLSKGIFTFKWKVWDSEDMNNTCCFKTTIQIKK